MVQKLNVVQNWITRLLSILSQLLILFPILTESGINPYNPKFFGLLKSF